MLKIQCENCNRITESGVVYFKEALGIFGERRLHLLCDKCYEDKYPDLKLRGDK